MFRFHGVVVWQPEIRLLLLLASQGVRTLPARWGNGRANTSYARNTLSKYYSSKAARERFVLIPPLLSACRNRFRAMCRNTAKVVAHCPYGHSFAPWLNVTSSALDAVFDAPVPIVPAQTLGQTGYRSKCRAALSAEHPLLVRSFVSMPIALYPTDLHLGASYASTSASQINQY
jgi:hypothetical protein